jgi:hypothetical protein
MKRFMTFAQAGLALCLWSGGDAEGRGFGGFRGGFGGFGGGGFHYGGYSGGGYHYGGGGYHYGDDYRGGSYSGSRSVSGYSGWRGGGASSSYDRSYDTARGGSITTEGTRGAAYGRYGGAAAGGTRDTSITTAGGKSYTGSREGGVAVGPYGRTVGGASHYGTATGARGTVSGGWQTAFAGTRFPTDVGLAHYSTAGVAGVGHTTAYWSRGTMGTTGGYVRSGFGYYNCFHPAWYTAHPGAWYAAGWASGAAWAAATWPAVGSYIGVASEPSYTYDYGSDIVYQNNTVYVGGKEAGTAQQYAEQATTLAVQGQSADAPPTADWKPLGVYALVPGDQKTSNNMFQLAVDRAGVIRGNYYDGLMDTTTPVYGSVDKKTQRAAWTIGKTKDRVFEAGLYNLTQPEAPVLVHFGADKTQQWLLVRVEQPASGK